MEYKLKNGKSVIIRPPVIEDAAAIINLISSADAETKYLARNPGEFCITEEQEKTFIADILKGNDEEWLVAVCDENVVGHCSVRLVSRYERYRHRAEVTFVVLKAYCGIGIGGRLMQESIIWCKYKNIKQIELKVVSDNLPAINMYEKFGFKSVGLIPNAIRYINGTFADEKIMILEL